MAIKVGIIDYSVSNLNSVYNAFGRIGVSAKFLINLRILEVTLI